MRLKLDRSGSGCLQRSALLSFHQELPASLVLKQGVAFVAARTRHDLGVAFLCSASEGEVNAVSFR